MKQIIDMWMFKLGIEYGVLTQYLQYNNTNPSMQRKMYRTECNHEKN